ncbi:MAG: ABC-F family ATP-binding cassette domain-containing protein, partial [Verrucomicrobia bacterium]|nr:ABC-F family ATP-binding cassette domain-containing protein [Verrucomicrobiota bacterium]
MADPVSVISAKELTVRYGPQTVLDETSLNIDEGERLGLVGRNGSGKSTFLQIAAGHEAPDAGEVVRRRELIVGYMPQQFQLEETASVHANIIAGARSTLELIDRYERTPADSQESAHLLERIEHLGGWTLEHRIKSLVEHLHAPSLERTVGDLSGGEKRRVALCRALVSQPDLLLLDEPTNHLDTGAIEWLEDFLVHYPGTCLFVTHDRYFLDKIATGIVELDRGKFLRYAGNYTDFLLARAAKQAALEQQERKRQKFLKRELEWVRRSPSARRTKSIDRVEKYFEMAAQEEPAPESEADLIIPPPPKLGERVIELKEVTLDIGGRKLIDGLNLDLKPGEKLGVIGANGLGKSSLLKVILSQLRPSQGEVILGPRVQINYIDQNRTLLDDQKTVWEEIGGGNESIRLGEETLSLRSYLRRFLFTEERINTKIELLSGGERNRLVLAKILKQGGNVLILDEPTNDLDLGTLRLLEEALIDFSGTVIVVSHDRYFLNRVATAILAFEGDAIVRYAVGDYDYYLEKRAEEQALLKAKPAAPSPNAKPAAPTANRPRKLKWKEERELETIEAQILEAENKVADLEKTFADPDFYKKHAKNSAVLESDLKSARERVTELYQRWEELERIKQESTGP